MALLWRSEENEYRGNREKWRICYENYGGKLQRKSLHHTS